MTGRRAPVQSRGDVRCSVGERRARHAAGELGLVDGTISWEEHVQAWDAYARRFGRDQSAERLAERGGFGYCELLRFLGRPPATWRPR